MSDSDDGRSARSASSASSHGGPGSSVGSSSGGSVPSVSLEHAVATSTPAKTRRAAAVVRYSSASSSNSSDEEEERGEEGRDALLALDEKDIEQRALPRLTRAHLFALHNNGGSSQQQQNQQRRLQQQQVRRPKASGEASSTSSATLVDDPPRSTTTPVSRAGAGSKRDENGAKLAQFMLSRRASPSESSTSSPSTQTQTPSARRGLSALMAQQAERTPAPAASRVSHLTTPAQRSTWTPSSGARTPRAAMRAADAARLLSTPLPRFSPPPPATPLPSLSPGSAQESARAQVRAAFERFIRGPDGALESARARRGRVKSAVTEAEAAASARKSTVTIRRQPLGGADANRLSSLGRLLEAQSDDEDAPLSPTPALNEQEEDDDDDAEASASLHMLLQSARKSRSEPPRVDLTSTHDELAKEGDDDDDLIGAELEPTDHESQVVSLLRRMRRAQDAERFIEDLVEEESRDHEIDGEGDAAVEEEEDAREPSPSSFLVEMSTGLAHASDGDDEESALTAGVDADTSEDEQEQASLSLSRRSAALQPSPRRSPAQAPVHREASPVLPAQLPHARQTPSPVSAPRRRTPSPAQTPASEARTTPRQWLPSPQSSPPREEEQSPKHPPSSLRRRSTPSAERSHVRFAMQSSSSSSSSSPEQSEAHQSEDEDMPPADLPDLPPPLPDSPEVSPQRFVRRTSPFSTSLLAARSPSSGEKHSPRHPRTPLRRADVVDLSGPSTSTPTRAFGAQPSPQASPLAFDDDDGAELEEDSMDEPEEIAQARPDAATPPTSRLIARAPTPRSAPAAPPASASPRGGRDRKRALSLGATALGELASLFSPVRAPHAHSRLPAEVALPASAESTRSERRSPASAPREKSTTTPSSARSRSREEGDQGTSRSSSSGRAPDSPLLSRSHGESLALSPTPLARDLPQISLPDDANVPDEVEMEQGGDEMTDEEDLRALARNVIRQAKGLSPSPAAASSPPRSPSAGAEVAPRVRTPKKGAGSMPLLSSPRRSREADDALECSSAHATAKGTAARHRRARSEPAFLADMEVDALVSRFEDLKACVLQTGQGVQRSVIRSVDKAATRTKTSASSFLKLAFISQLILIFLFLRVSRLRADAMYQSLYFDPHFPALYLPPSYTTGGGGADLLDETLRLFSPPGAHLRTTTGTSLERFVRALLT